MDRQNCKHENARFSIEFADGWNNATTMKGMANAHAVGDAEIVGKLSVLCPDCKMRITYGEMEMWVKYDVSSEIQEALIWMTKEAKNISDIDERLHSVSL